MYLCGVLRDIKKIVAPKSGLSLENAILYCPQPLSIFVACRRISKMFSPCKAKTAFFMLEECKAGIYSRLSFFMILAPENRIPK